MVNKKVVRKNKKSVPGVGPAKKSRSKSKTKKPPEIDLSKVAWPVEKSLWVRFKDWANGR